MPVLLIVEDDYYAAAGLSEHLERAGYITVIVRNGATAINRILNARFDLILLDLVLPDMSGFDVLRSIREAGSTIPVIVMSALVDVSHRLAAYRQGADHFLGKPFDVAELIALIPTRLNPHIAQSATKQPLSIDIAGRSVAFHDTPIRLTGREFDLLCVLNQEPSVVRTKVELLQTVWATSAKLKTHTVSQHIISLRKKLRAAGVRDAIRTVHGRGWVWSLPNCIVQQDPARHADASPESRP